MPFAILRSIWKYILFAIIILVVRSPILMFIVGFVGGVATYHFYPEQTEEKVEVVLEKVEEAIGVNPEALSSCIKGNSAECLRGESNEEVRATFNP